MGNGYFSAFSVVLVGAVAWLSYRLGIRKEQNASFKKKAEAVAEANRLRDSLNDPAVVDELHKTFKR